MTSAESMQRTRAVLVDVAEQLLARQLLAAPHDRAPRADLRPRHRARRHPCRGSAGAAGCRARRRGGCAAWSGRTNRCSRAYSSLPTRTKVVSSRRTSAASTASRDGRLAPRRLSEVARDACANARQRPAERFEAVELVVVALLAPLRVIAVLLAPACIAAGGLQVTVGQRADPHRVVRRRDRQRADAARSRARRAASGRCSRDKRSRGRGVRAGCPACGR